MGIFKKLFARNKKTEPSEEKKDEVKLKQSDSVYKQSIKAFFENFESPNVIDEKIFEMTKSDEKATLIYLFIPYFFCRKVLPEVKWTNYYNVKTEAGKIISYKFHDSQILMELKDDIDKNWKKYSGMDLNKILYHSGDFKVINELMHKGQKLEEMELLPPTILE